MVTTSFFDVARLAAAFELTVDELLGVLSFYVLPPDVTRDAVKRMVLPPALVEEKLVVVGLAKDESGTCVYYDPAAKRCRAYEVRPMTCRTFPFTFRYLATNRGTEKTKSTAFKLRVSLTEKGKRYCEGLKPSARPPFIHLKEWKRVGAETIREYLHHQLFVEKWNELVERGEVVPSAVNFVDTILRTVEELRAPPPGSKKNAKSGGGKRARKATLS